MFKKSFAVLIAVIILSMIPLSVAAAGTVYTDSTTGVSFTVPEGWSEDNFSKDREFLKVKYTPITEDGATFMFGYGDIWSEMSASEKMGYTRADINHEFMKKEFAGEDLATAFGIDEEECISDNVLYNGTEYMRLKYTTEVSAFGVSMDMTMIMLYHFYNGYMISFQYGDIYNNPHYNEFEVMMNSVTYPTVSSSIGIVTDDSSSDSTSSVYVPSYDYDTDDTYTTDSDNKTGKGSEVVYFEDDKLKFDFPLFIASVIFTIVIYSLPIIIYRYAVKKQPLPEKKAKKITIIYGIIAFIIMCAINGGAGAAIVFWSTVNYKMLTKPSKNDVSYPTDYENKDVTTKISDTVVPLAENKTEQTAENVVAIEPEIIENTEKIEEIEPQEPTPEQPEQNTDQEPELKPEPVKEPPKPIITAPQQAATNSVLFCRKCGARLTADSEFCHKCGIRVIK